jgi:hypothetical protein
LSRLSAAVDLWKKGSSPTSFSKTADRSQQCKNVTAILSEG